MEHLSWTGIRRRFKALFVLSQRLPFIGLFIRAGVKCSRDWSVDMAASIAFFAFFSLFPLVLGIIAAGSLLLDSNEVQSYLYSLIEKNLPGSAEWITDNINSLIRYRGTAGITSVLMLLWSSKRVTAAISRSINKALGETRDHSALLSPLRNFAITLAVTLLLLIPVTIGPILQILNSLDVFALGSTSSRYLDFATEEVTDVLASALSLCLLYMLVSYHRQPKKSVFLGALTTATGFLLSKKLFLIYIDNFSHLEALYGSVTSIIVLMLWLYLSAYLLIYGAEVIFIDKQGRNGRQQQAIDMGA